jgi:hypothetical protein
MAESVAQGQRRASRLDMGQRVFLRLLRHPGRAWRRLPGAIYCGGRFVAIKFSCSIYSQRRCVVTRNALIYSVQSGSGVCIAQLGCVNRASTGDKLSDKSPIFAILDTFCEIDTIAKRGWFPSNGKRPVWGASGRGELEAHLLVAHSSAVSGAVAY